MNDLWLEQGIATQLGLANAWLTRTDGTTDEKWAALGLYEDSGSCLRISEECRCRHTLRIVQRDPLTLTDGAVSIEASLSPECKQSVRTLHQGLSLVVRKYTIRYTPYGPPRDRLGLTLDIAHIDSQNKTNEGPSGDVRPIHLCAEIIESLNKLQRIRAESDRKCFGIVESEAEEAHSMSSRGHPVEVFNNEEGSPNTQMAYGTQMVSRIRTPSKGSGERIELPPEKPSNDFEKRNELLGLLWTKPAGPRAGVLPNEPRGAGIEGASTEPRAMREDRTDTQFINVTDDTHDKAPRSNAPKAPSAGGFTRTSSSRASNKCVAQPTDRVQPAPLPPRYPSDNTTERPASSVIQYRSGSPIIRHEEGSSDKLQNTTSGGSLQSQFDKSVLEDIKPEWLKDTCLADGCGKVLGAQQKLLSSWQKPRAGTTDRFPGPNIPIRVLEALKRFEINAASLDTDLSDGESSTTSDANLVERENVTHSDGDNETEISWPSSPIESPKRPLPPDLALPPDSSNPEKSVGSQSGSQEASSGQEAQRPVAIQSSNEDSMLQPASSPPLVSGDDHDSDMDMVLDVPRGLEDTLARNVVPGSTTHQRASTVQVKETPYPKKKSTASASDTNNPGQAQQQSSSGTSKDTSSTSIVYSSYKEPKSPGKNIAHNAEFMSHKPITLASTYDGHRDTSDSDDLMFYEANEAPVQHAEPVDVRMEDIGVGWLAQSSPRLEDKRQDKHPPTSSLKLPDDPSKRLECEDEDRISSFVTHEPSPASAQMPRSVEQSTVKTIHAKRKFKDSPSKHDRRSSKNRKIKVLWDRNSPARDSGEEFWRKEKEASLENFKAKTRAASLTSDVSDSDSIPQAKSIHPPSPLNTSHRMEEPPIHAQAYSVINPNSPRSTASGEKMLQLASIPKNDTRELNRDQPLSPLMAPELPEVVEMEIDSTHTEHSNIDTTSPNANIEDLEVEQAEGYQIEMSEVDNTEICNMDTEHAASGRDVARRTLTLSPGPIDRTSEAAPDTIISTEVRTSMVPSKPKTIFEKFKTTYPAYTGDIRHFLGQCKQMVKLDEQDKMVPKWQWDDFIIRNRTDYKEYANRCLDNGEDAEPYYRFYKDNIRNTLYTEGVIGSRRTLTAAIEQLEGKAVASAGATEMFTSERIVAKEPNASSPGVKAPFTSAKTFAAGLGTSEQPSSSPSGQRKPRQSLPSAFNKRIEGITSTSSKPSSGRPRQSLPTSSSRSLSSLPNSSSRNKRTTPAKQASRLSTSNSVSPRPGSLHGTSSGSYMPTEPTGDPFRDFVFAQSRATSFTGSARVDPERKWPENLHGRPVAQVRRKGYDVLDWKDDL